MESIAEAFMRHFRYLWKGVWGGVVVVAYGVGGAIALIFGTIFGVLKAIFSLITPKTI